MHFAKLVTTLVLVLLLAPLLGLAEQAEAAGPDKPSQWSQRSASWDTTYECDRFSGRIDWQTHLVSKDGTRRTSQVTINMQGILVDVCRQVQLAEFTREQKYVFVYDTGGQIHFSKEVDRSFSVEKGVPLETRYVWAAIGGEFVVAHVWWNGKLMY